jgi:hypothetical protein
MTGYHVPKIEAGKAFRERRSGDVDTEKPFSASIFRAQTIKRAKNLFTPAKPAPLVVPYNLILSKARSTLAKFAGFSRNPVKTGLCAFTKHRRRPVIEKKRVSFDSESIKTDTAGRVFREKQRVATN